MSEAENRPLWRRFAAAVKNPPLPQLNWPEIRSSSAELVGISLFSVGFGWFSPGLGMISGGIGLIVVGLTLGRPPVGHDR